MGDRDQDQADTWPSQSAPVGVSISHNIGQAASAVGWSSVRQTVAVDTCRHRPWTLGFTVLFAALQQQLCGAARRWL